MPTREKETAQASLLVRCLPSNLATRDSGRETRLEALLENLTGQVAQLARAQEEDRRGPLSRPLLASLM